MMRLQDRFLFELRLHQFILCTRCSGGTAHEGGGYYQSIGTTVSAAIVCSCLWSTATRSYPLGYFIIIIYLSRVSTKADRMPIQMWASQQLLATSNVINQFTLPRSLRYYILVSKEYTIHTRIDLKKFQFYIISNLHHTTIANNGLYG